MVKFSFVQRLFLKVYKCIGSVKTDIEVQEGFISNLIFPPFMIEFVRIGREFRWELKKWIIVVNFLALQSKFVLESLLSYSASTGI